MEPERGAKRFISMYAMIDAEMARSERLAGGRLAVLYERHATDAIRLAYLLTGDRALAEDLVQDAFVRLAGRFLDLRDPNGFTLYLRRTVINLANSHFRRRRVERAWAAREPAEGAIPAGAPDPATTVAVRRALATLTPRQRAAIALRYYGDLSELEIAQTLECRPGTVKSLLSRGIDTLRDQLRGE